PRPQSPDSSHCAHEAAAVALARLQLPRLVLAGEESAAVKREQLLAVALHLRGLERGAREPETRIDIVHELLEIPGIEPDVAALEREAALMQRNRLVLAEELAQPVQRARERTMRRIAVDARPHRVDDARLAHLLAAAGDEHLQHLQRPLLRLARGAEGCI